MSEKVKADDLIGKLWKFGHKGDSTSHIVEFLPDGSIGRYNHPNERYWSIEDGVIVLSNAQKEPTVLFDEVTLVNSQPTYCGAHLPDPKILLCLTERIDWEVYPGTRAALAREIQTLGWEIGAHTYGVPTFMENGYAKLTIGKYTSIASGVRISFADHKTSTVSTYPFNTLGRYWPSAPQTSDHVSKGDIEIGNDVWIGTDVFINSGVRIGHGAVLGARCLVTKDVPPYAVVGGVPAKHIRFRFSSRLIDQLLKLAWWNWPDQVVDRYLPYITSKDIEAFIAKATNDPVIRALSNVENVKLKQVHRARATV